MDRSSHRANGFTLIEMLIVVIILGILAMFVMPQVAITTDDAKLSTLQNNLNTIRAAYTLYYAEHNNVFPAAADPPIKPADVTTLSDVFAAQLTRYTDVNGNISNAKNATFKYGPYLKTDTFPVNSYNGLNDITIDAVETDITVFDSTGAGTGWKFYALTGVLIAADGAHDDE